MPPRADPPPPARVSEVRARLWDISSPLPPGSYEAPWGGIAVDLWERLAAALSAPAAFGAAAPASHLGYAACVKTLIRGSPPVHRILTDIRGLALAVAPALVDAEKDRAVAAAPPGSALVYETLAY